MDSDAAGEEAAKVPYKATPVFDENTLPKKLRQAHSTASGVWGIIRLLEGKHRYVIEGTGAESILSPERPGLVLPEQLHHVEPLGKMRMRIEFYDAMPDIGRRFEKPKPAGI